MTIPRRFKRKIKTVGVPIWKWPGLLWDGREVVIIRRRDQFGRGWGFALVPYFFWRPRLLDQVHGQRIWGWLCFARADYGSPVTWIPAKPITPKPGPRWPFG